MKSIAERLPQGFRLIFNSYPAQPHLQIGGPIGTRDELDAVIEAMQVMRDWLPPAIAMEARQGETRLHPKDDSAGPKDIAQ